MAYDLAKVTANGNNLIAQILANKSSLSIDKIEISDTQLSSTTDISTMTSVPKVVQTVSANGFSKNSNTLIISTVVDNSSISADYKAWVFGIWGSDSQNGQSQLIAVITSTNSPDTIPAFSGSTPVSYTYKFNIGFSNASQIQFNMIDDAFATNDTVVHTTGDETVDGKKAFKVDPVDGAGNAYAKTVDVNQQLDKKVNVSDMRKPASDVVGLEDVSQALVKTALTDQTDLDTVTTSGIYPFNNIHFVNFIDTVQHWGYLEVVSQGEIVCQTIYIDYASNTCFQRKQVGSPAIWTTWVRLADDSKVVHNSGDETIGGTKTFSNPIKGTIDGITYRYSAVGDDLDTSYMIDSVVFVGGQAVLHAPAGTDGTWAIIRNYNSNATNGAQSYYDTNRGLLYVRTRNSNTTYTPWIQIADDSKVAHLSGANNFDTVPTVNNNPLLLASSLPSDLARTGQAQTFTQPQTFSIAPVINDASKDKGDNQAATMADLKSVENSAWRVLDQSNAPSTISFRGQVLYKIDDANKIIYFTTNGLMTNNGSNLILIDFKGIVNNLLSGYGRLASIARKTYIDDSDISVTSTYVKNSSILNYQEDTNVNLISYGGPGQNYAYVIYDSLVNN